MAKPGYGYFYEDRVTYDELGRMGGVSDKFCSMIGPHFQDVKFRISQSVIQSSCSFLCTQALLSIIIIS